MGLVVARIASCGRHRLVLKGFVPIKPCAVEMANAGYPVRLILEAVKVNRVFNIISGGNFKIEVNRFDALLKCCDIEPLN
ncbi:hypothetical protein [Burkholderia sp. LMG 21824]|uniref:hypothetical protein n=1 Tax=Burkholderia sp. LMG 21824 TaxID=3158172 RepID=UPI003C2C7D1C